jgi:hypothetical protein
MDEIVAICRKKIDKKGFDIDCLAVGSNMTFEL